MTQPEPAAAQLRRRREAALKCEPIRPGVGVARRDPWLDEVQNPSPSTFGLRRHELRAEVERRIRDGWAPWELVERFINPTEVAA